MPREEAAALGDYAYLVALSESDLPDEYRVWRVGLRDPPPTVAVPLTPDVPPVRLALQTAFERCYDASFLGRGIDHRRETEPPLPATDEAWVETVLRRGGLLG